MVLDGTNSASYIYIVGNLPGALSLATNFSVRTRDSSESGFRVQWFYTTWHSLLDLTVVIFLDLHYSKEILPKHILGL